MFGDSVTCLIILVSFKKFLWSLCVIIWRILSELSHEGDSHPLFLSQALCPHGTIRLSPREMLPYSGLARKVGESRETPSLVRGCLLKLGGWLYSSSVLLVTDSKVVGLSPAVFLRHSVIPSFAYTGLLSVSQILQAPSCIRPLWTDLSFC